MVKKLIVSDVSVFVHYPGAFEKDSIRQENIAQHGGDAVAECFHFLAKFKEFLVYTYIMVVAYDLSTIFIAFSVRTEDREMNKFFLQLFIIHCR